MSLLLVLFRVGLLSLPPSAPFIHSTGRFDRIDLNLSASSPYTSHPLSLRFRPVSPYPFLYVYVCVGSKVMSVYIYIGVFSRYIAGIAYMLVYEAFLAVLFFFFFTATYFIYWLFTGFFIVIGLLRICGFIRCFFLLVCCLSNKFCLFIDFLIVPPFCIAGFCICSC